MASGAPQLFQTLEVTNLPSLPHVLLQVMEMCSQDEASLRAISDILDKDAALAAKVIGASNSAQFGRQNNIASLEQKLALLGLDLVQTIVISASVYQVFSNFNNDSKFDPCIFWKRSLTSAFIAKLIAQKISYPHPEEAYITGLLLDVGQLVLLSNFPKQYAELLVDKVDDVELMVRESESLGMNHCEVGSWLAGSWNLKSFMADALLYHHVKQDQLIDTHPLIQIINIANSLAMAEDNDAEVFLAGERLLGVTPEGFQKIVDDARKLVVKVAQSLGIEIDVVHPEAGEVSQLGSIGNADLNEKKMQLAMELGNVALVGRKPLHLGATNTLDDVLLSIQRSALILFGIKSTVFFMPDQYSKKLKCKSLSGQDEIINELSVPLNKGNSIVTDTFLTKVTSATFSAGDISTPRIIDEQIIRLMQTEILDCHPMIIQSAVVGIMVFGLTPKQYAQAEKQKKLISRFVQQSAQAIAALSALNSQEERIKNEVMASTRIKAQKTVHEANNPLGIIKNYIKLLGARLSNEDPAQEDLKIIREEIDRVSRILRTVSLTEGLDAGPREELNVNDVIQSLGKILVDAFFSQYQVVVKMQLDLALPNIVVDKDKLMQVLINLMKNAAEAMPNGGMLTISTRANVTHNGSEYIEVVVKDDGPGIPARIMESLFKPVTSSKGGGHSGLGLSIVKNIIDELGGAIFCQSNELSGTTFQILLPAAVRA